MFGSKPATRLARCWPCSSLGTCTCMQPYSTLSSVSACGHQDIAGKVTDNFPLYSLLKARELRSLLLKNVPTHLEVHTAVSRFSLTNPTVVSFPLRAVRLCSWHYTRALLKPWAFVRATRTCVSSHSHFIMHIQMMHPKTHRAIYILYIIQHLDTCRPETHVRRKYRLHFHACRIHTKKVSQLLACNGRHRFHRTSVFSLCRGRKRFEVACAPSMMPAEQIARWHERGAKFLSPLSRSAAKLVSCCFDIPPRL